MITEGLLRTCKAADTIGRAGREAVGGGSAGVLERTRAASATGPSKAYTRPGGGRLATWA